MSVGADHDTAAFAVESIRRWWRTMGQPLYPAAQRLLITADGGGSTRFGICRQQLAAHPIPHLPYLHQRFLTSDP